MIDQAQPLLGIKALRFRGDTVADVLRRIVDWESSLEYSKSILVIAFENQWKDGESAAIVYYEDV